MEEEAKAESPFYDYLEEIYTGVEAMENLVYLPQFEWWHVVLQEEVDTVEVTEEIKVQDLNTIYYVQVHKSDYVLMMGD